MPLTDVLPAICLVVGAALTLLAALVLPPSRQWLCAPVALVALAVTAVTAARLMLAGEQSITFFGTWALDSAALWATQIVLAAAALVVVASPEWLRTEPRHGEYYAIVLFAALGAVMMASATDTMELILGVLLSSVTGYVLASYHRRSPRSVEAGMKYFLIGGLANAVLALGVVLLFGLAGSTLYGETAATLPQRAEPLALVSVVALVTVGLAFKIGAFPAHTWMPDVAEGAPAPVAGLLTVIGKVGGLVALGRLLSLLPHDQIGWRALAALLAAVTMTLGNLAALWQDDVRRLLGWSAVSQSGYGLMALVALGESDLALPSLLFFLAAYTVANLAAFLVVVELRGRTRLGAYAGLGHVRPWVGAVLGVSLLSLVGIPPLAGFTAKLTLFAAVIDAGYAWLAWLAVVNTVISLFYYLRVLGPLYFAPAPARVPVLGQWAGAAALVAAAATVVLGVAAEPLLAAFSQAQLLP